MAERPSTMLRILLRPPGAYPLLAFLLGKRIVVRGPSMSPTLLPGERVLFDRLAYLRGEPGRGDVVLAEHPSRPGMRIVKRIAAAMGDSVTVAGETRTLGEDEWLLLGDAPDASTDGRDFGPVKRQAILARAWLVYWPPARMRRVRG